MSIRIVLLIPSDDFSWSGLEQVVRAMPNVRVVRVATDTGQTADIAGRLAPDIILMAEAIRSVSTVPLVCRLRACCPTSKLIVLANNVPCADAMEVMASADVTADVLWRDLIPSAFEHLLSLVIETPCRISSEVVAEAFAARWEHHSEADANEMLLSVQERRVLNLIVHGKTYKDIARQLDISPNTVGTHVERIKGKLDVRMRAEVVAIAIRHGLPDT